jgi:hypothetical protein
MSSDASTATPLDGTGGRQRLTDFWVVRALTGGCITSVLFVALMVGVFQTGKGRTQVVLIFLASPPDRDRLQVFTGNSGVISFGMSRLMAIGGYTAMLMNLSVSSKRVRSGSALASSRMRTLRSSPQSCDRDRGDVSDCAPVRFRLRPPVGHRRGDRDTGFYEIVITVIASNYGHARNVQLYGLETYPNDTLFWWMIDLWSITRFSSRASSGESGQGALAEGNELR